MVEFNHYFALLACIFALNYFFTRIPFFKDNKKIFKHKSFINQKTNPPFSGGAILVLLFLFFLPNEYIYFKIFLVIFFLLGLISDTNIIESPNTRFFLQLLFILVFIESFQITINSVRIEFFDYLLQYHVFSVFFSCFCLMVLINGSNFIDGVNTLAIGYYLIVFISITFFTNIFDNVSLNKDLFITLIFILFCLFILNFLELLYLGDNGSYLISFLAGVILIYLSIQSDKISPYYIMNLLWLPAYENLFSIIRKLKSKKSAFNPDNLHLHHLIFRPQQILVGDLFFNNFLA